MSADFRRLALGHPDGALHIRIRFWRNLDELILIQASLVEGLRLVVPNQATQILFLFVRDNFSGGDLGLLWKQLGQILPHIICSLSV